MMAKIVDESLIYSVFFRVGSQDHRVAFLRFWGLRMFSERANWHSLMKDLKTSNNASLLSSDSNHVLIFCTACSGQRRGRQDSSVWLQPMSSDEKIATWVNAVYDDVSKMKPFGWSVCNLKSGKWSYIYENIYIWYFKTQVAGAI